MDDYKFTVMWKEDVMADVELYDKRRKVRIEKYKNTFPENPFYGGEVTPERVKAYFGDMVRGEVIRYDVPSLQGFNFVMKHALGGGATHSLRLDSLGKSMGSAFLRMKIEVGEEEIG